jgi:hypothetical protein
MIPPGHTLNRPARATRISMGMSGRSRMYFLGSSQITSLYMFSRHWASRTTYQSWRTRSFSAERERDNTVKQQYVPCRPFKIISSAIFHSKHDDAMTDQSVRGRLSTDRANYDARVGHESPLYLSKSLGRNDKFRYMTTNNTGREPRETRRENPESVLSNSKASDPTITKSLTEPLGQSDAITPGRQRLEDPGNPELALYVSSIIQSM